MPDLNPATSYRVVIRPNRGWWRVDWRAIVEFKDLLFLLVRRDFVSKHQQTLLGPAWFILQPLLTTLIFTVVFGHIAQISTEGVPATLFYLCGLLSWSYFSQNLTHTGATFNTNAALFSKVYFPRLIVPLASGVSNMLNFALQLLTFVCFYVYFRCFVPSAAHLAPNAALLLLPFLLLQAGFLSIGVGLWFSAMTAKYWDFGYLMPLILQLWMYATPVIYPMSKVPQRYLPFAVLNPMSAVVEVFRFAFFGVGTLNAMHCVVSLAITALVFISGVMIFQKVERTVVDTL